MKKKTHEDFEIEYKVVFVCHIRSCEKSSYSERERGGELRKRERDVEREGERG